MQANIPYYVLGSRRKSRLTLPVLTNIRSSFVISSGEFDPNNRLVAGLRSGVVWISLTVTYRGGILALLYELVSELLNTQQWKYFS